jgi:MinD-like ATPase involved in chromosome partitioning or flagellar assembly
VTDPPVPEASALSRRRLYADGVVDGRPAPNGALGRFKRQVDSLLVSRREREEAELEAALRACPGVTRANVVALISPKGGVGKTTCTFLAGNLLASHLRLRPIAIDASSGFGMLGRLPGEPVRSQCSLIDLLDELDRIHSATELRRYVSLLPSGLHVLAGPADPLASASLGTQAYGELVASLACFYDVVLLDLGPGVTGPLARFAVKRADQVVLVTTPDPVASTLALDALGHLDRERTTVVLNKTTASTTANLPEEWVPIPYDERLALMLDSGTYSLEALNGDTRRPIKRLGLVIAQQLV